MAKKHADISKDTILVSKDAAASTVTSGRRQRGETAREKLVDLNFKVPRAFRTRFRRLAVDADITHAQLLNQLVELYEERPTRQDEDG